jgi:NarL family two-component system response regulator LiaR
MAEITSDRIRVVICDDHFLIREGLKAVISRTVDIDVVGAAGSAEDAIQLVEDLLPDVVIMDIMLPGIDGIQATRMIKHAFPSVAVVALTRFDDVEHIMDLYRAGAAAYLMKGVEADELLETIHAVSKGRIVLHARVAREVIQTFSEASAAIHSVGHDAVAPSGLSQRELEVLRLVAQGKTNKEIALTLTLSVRTVQNHLANIFRKLELNDRISAALYAINEGIAKADSSTTGSTASIVHLNASEYEQQKQSRAGGRSRRP